MNSEKRSFKRFVIREENISGSVFFFLVLIGIKIYI